MKKPQEFQKDGYRFREDNFPILCGCGHRSKRFWWKEFRDFEAAVNIRTRIVCDEDFQKGVR